MEVLKPWQIKNVSFYITLNKSCALDEGRIYLKGDCVCVSVTKLAVLCE